MTITETIKIDFARTMVLWKVAAARRSLMPCSQNLSAIAKMSETPERR